MEPENQFLTFLTCVMDSPLVECMLKGRSERGISRAKHPEVVYGHYCMPVTALLVLVINMI